MKISSPGFRPKPLAAGLALAFAAGASLGTIAHAASMRGTSTSSHHEAAVGSPASPIHVATTYEVTSCADDGSAGTLRYVIDHAGEGDAVDLSNLTCSTITLASGEILIPENDFTVASTHAVTIDGGGANRVIEHDGNGTLYLHDIAVSNGYFKYNSGTGMAKGGCILSNGTVRLTTTNVSYCKAVNTNGQVRGGAIYAFTGVQEYAYSDVSHSAASGRQALGGGIFSFGSVLSITGRITDNTAISTDDSAEALASGGGLFTDGNAHLSNSVISGNTAQADNGDATAGGVRADVGVYLAFTSISGNAAVSAASNGGGVLANRASYVYYSTLDHNRSVDNAAAWFGGPDGNVRIGNSTISNNTASTGSSAVFASIPLFLYNSTVAFNAAAGTSAGVYLYASTPALVESSILAGNTSSSGVEFDLVAAAVVAGSHDLIESPSAVVPGDTLIGVDPELEPLAANFTLFGPQTNALAPTSPAIDRGANPRNFDNDERGFGDPRVFGLSADIGAYEWHGEDTDTIFANGFD